MKKRLALVSIALLVLVAGVYLYFRNTGEPYVPPVASTPVIAKPEAPKPPNVDELLTLTNAERAKVGVAPLKLDERLDKSAQAWANDMVKYGYGHTNATTGNSSKYVEQYMGFACLKSSENIEAGTSSQEAITEWLASPPHKEAMLDARYDLTGYGIAKYKNYYYVVEHFCDLK